MILSIPMISLHLQLDLRSDRYLEVFDALNPLVVPTWPYLRWPWRYRQKYPIPRNRDDFATPTTSLGLQLDPRLSSYIDVFDTLNPLAPSTWPYLRWLWCYHEK